MMMQQASTSLDPRQPSINLHCIDSGDFLFVIISCIAKYFEYFESRYATLSLLARGHSYSIKINFALMPDGHPTENYTQRTCFIVRIIATVSFITKFHSLVSGLLTHRSCCCHQRAWSEFRKKNKTHSKNYQEANKTAALTAFCDWKWKSNSDGKKLRKTFARLESNFLCLWFLDKKKRAEVRWNLNRSTRKLKESPHKKPLAERKFIC